MTTLFLLVLVFAWVAVFLPALLRARRDRPYSSAERFKRRMALMAPRASRGRWIIVPESRERLTRAAYLRGQRHRRRLFVFLLAAALLSAPAAMWAGGSMWEAQLLLDGSLGLYVVLLLEAKRRRAERSTKVEPLRERGPRRRSAELDSALGSFASRRG